MTDLAAGLTEKRLREALEVIEKETKKLRESKERPGVLIVGMVRLINEECKATLALPKTPLEKQAEALIRENKGRDLHIQKLVDALMLLKRKLNRYERCSYCKAQEPHDCNCIWRVAAEAIYYDPEDDHEILDKACREAGLK